MITTSFPKVLRKILELSNKDGKYLKRVLFKHTEADEIETVVHIMVPNVDGGRKAKPCKLDTGAEANLVSDKALPLLGLIKEPCDPKFFINHLGSAIWPLGQLEFT